MSKQIRNPFADILYFVRGTISEEINCQLLGKILTIIDGTIVEEKQNKAIKDLVKGEFYPRVRGMQRVINDCIKEEAKLNSQEIEEEFSEDTPNPINI